MEVTKTSFPHHLLGILTAISEADFVSFDLEMSGIPSKMTGIPRVRDHATLEDRYAECKAGAEKYQVLQVGITCARFDWITREYVLRPYNFNISPLVSERVDIEREICLQTGAMSFLLDHGFKFDLAYREGIEYLSRDEAQQAKQSAFDRIDKKNVVEDLHLKETDIESLDFIRRVREAITAWTTTNQAELEITTFTGLKKSPNNVPAITRFEKRLVHQLVRAEFPNVVAIGRPDHMRIKLFDAEREASAANRMKARVKEQISNQSGFRWVIEALAAGNLDVTPAYVARTKDGEFTGVNFQDTRNKLRSASLRISNKQPVLVGHNMFMDLVYFYRTFIGQLPETLHEFSLLVHGLFPRIVDTKYLATFSGGDLHASPTLQEINQGLAKQPLPVIKTASEHAKYENTQALHEAGYDSLLTAIILLRLSTNVHAAEPKEREDAGNSSSPSSFATACESFTTDGQDNHKADPELSLIDEEDTTPMAFTKNRKKKRKNKKAADPPTKKTEDRNFATTNMFEKLSVFEPEDSNNHQDIETESDAQKYAWDSEPSFNDPVQPLGQVVERDPMEMIPDFKSANQEASE